MSEDTAVKGHKEELLIYANYVLRTYECVFTASEQPDLKVHEDSVSIMFFDMALLYLKHTDDGKVVCVASIYDDCSVILLAEFMCVLKDIFKEQIYVNEDTYIQDPAGNDLIWGRNNIDTHHERVWGKKITHTVMFDDSMAGHG